MSEDEFAVPDTPAQAVELEFQGNFDNLRDARERLKTFTLELLDMDTVPRERVLNLLALTKQAIELLMLHFTEDDLADCLREDQRKLIDEIFGEDD